MPISNLFRLVKKAPKDYWYYRKISDNIDFMSRYTLLWMIHILNALLWGLITNIVEKAHVFFQKSFVFHTSFGTFLGSTVNQWTVLAPDYEPEIQNVIKECTEKTPIPERVLINIGAHIGRYAIELVKNYHYTAYCFEPNPPTYRALKINTLLSRIEDKCFVFNYALGNETGEVQFEHIPQNDGSSRILQWNEHAVDKKAVITVPVKVFDELHSDIQPSLIIMDVEGFEYFVLQGMQKSLERYKQVDIIIEVFPDNPYKEKVLHLMQAHWYQYSYIDKDNIHFRKI